MRLEIFSIIFYRKLYASVVSYCANKSKIKFILFKTFTLYVGMSTTSTPENIMISAEKYLYENQMPALNDKQNTRFAPGVNFTSKAFIFY